MQRPPLANQRYYSYQIGRFLTPDPYVANDALSDPQSWNRYAYVGNDPINFVDPSGTNRDDPDRPRGRRVGLPGWVLGVYYDAEEGGIGSYVTSSWGTDTGGGDDFDDTGGGGDRKLSPREIMLKRRARVHDAIYGTADTAFGPEALDCMAGRESDWNSNADNGLGFRGMFQMGEAAWNDVYAGTKKPVPYLPNVFDASKATAATAAYLNILLQRVVGMAEYAAGNYLDIDLKEAIRRYNSSDIAESYANQVWDCAQKLKAGDLNGALEAIGKP